MTPDNLYSSRQDSGVVRSQSEFDWNAVRDSRSAGRLRCEPPMVDEGQRWFDTPEHLFASAEKIDYRIGKDWARKAEWIKSYEDLIFSWGPPTGVIQVLRDYMLGEILKDFDPLGAKELGRQLDELKKVEFFKARVLEAFVKQEMRDRSEMEQASVGDPDANRLEAPEADSDEN